jgi:hypothetical protein
MTNATSANARPAELTAWLTNRLPDDWRAAGAPAITVDREEIVVLLAVSEPEITDQSTAAAATDGRIAGFRDDTRDRRISIALEAEALFERKVSWGARCGGRTAMFTHLAAPVMTRLRQPERLVLDTLVAGGVARSRSDALAWCVRLVGQHTGDWLDELRTALQDVDRIRAQGPEAG